MAGVVLASSLRDRVGAAPPLSNANTIGPRIMHDIFAVISVCRRARKLWRFGVARDTGASRWSPFAIIFTRHGKPQPHPRLLGYIHPTRTCPWRLKSPI
ncbi:hypothetical protein VTN02DRAFT_1181 [Thermoascus thermophilus]